jgi:hypothetical protein
VRRLVALALVVVALAGCGSSSGRQVGRIERPPRGTLAALWNAGGEAVGLINGTSDYSPGVVRMSFLVVRRDARPVDAPRALVYVARSRTARPFERTSAPLEHVGVPGRDSGTATSVYVAHVRIPRPGRYWVVAVPAGSRVRALGTLDVHASSASPAVGSKAFPSRTPTIASTHGDFALLTTRVPPDRELLRYSVAGSLAAHKPFVVVFATPKFCTSRTCGPTVDVVDTVRRRFRRTNIRFIHVEVYRRNDPTLGLNRFMREWRLPTEPWIFLVGSDGRIRAKFEGPVSVQELAAAVRGLS